MGVSSMKMTYQKNAYEMPDGKYVARFKGVTMREATGQLDQRGNPMPPGMTWDFEIVEGDQAGKKADKLTGRNPTPKSGCGKFLAAIADAVLTDGQEIDIGKFVDRIYRITIIENRVSDNPAPVLVHDYKPGSAPAAPSRPAPPSKPAPPSGNGTAATNRKFWLDCGNGQVDEFMEATAVDFLTGRGIDTAKTLVCVDGTEEWKTAESFGLKTAF
jgi:hypothetical protein